MSRDWEIRNMFTFNYNEELEEAVFEDNVQKVLDLLPVGLYNSFIRSCQFTLLHYASSVKIARHLLLCGANVDAKNFVTSETPLFTAITLRRSPELIRELLKHGASVRTRNEYKNSPLNHAVQRSDCNVDVVKVLLEYGAIVNADNQEWNTPLNSAVRYYRGNLDVIRVLLEHDADTNAKNLKGDTSLHTAVQNRHCTLSLIEELLKHNAEVNAVNCDGNTPMHYAAMYLPGFGEGIIRELGRHGAKITIKNHSGITALDYAIRNKCGESNAKLLIKHALLNKNCNPLFGVKPDHKENVLSQFEKACRKDITQMKKNKIHKNYSLFDYLIEDSNEDIDDHLYKFLQKYIYPIYNDLILSKIKRNIFLDIVLQEGIHSQEKGADVPVFLNSYSVEYLAKYLSRCDLREMAMAYYIPGKKGGWHDILKNQIEAMELVKNKSGKL